tara:strand:+ start:17930 stop:20005 length:2076 start_codon:yes stop_codon:yes gene_type:complete
MPSFTAQDIYRKINQGSSASLLASTTTGATGGVAKALNSISKVPGYEESLSLSRGVSAAGFAAIKKSFVPMTANVPQNLTEIKALNEITLAVAQQNTGTTAQLTREIENIKNSSNASGGSIGQLAQQGNLPGVAKLIGSGSQAAEAASIASGLGGLPGGARTATAIVNNLSGAQNLAAPGLSDVSTVAVDLAEKAFNGASNPFGGGFLPDAIEGGLNDIPGGLTKNLLSDLPSGVQAQLQSALSSLTTGGGSTIKLPTVAFNTFDRSGITNQIDQVLGNPIIPRPTIIGATIPTGSFGGPLSDLRDKALDLSRNQFNFNQAEKEYEQVFLVDVPLLEQQINAYGNPPDLSIEFPDPSDPRIAQELARIAQLRLELTAKKAKAVELYETMFLIGFEFKQDYVPGKPVVLPTPPPNPADDLAELIASQTIASNAGLQNGQVSVTQQTSTNQNSLSGETNFAFADYGNGVVVNTFADSTGDNDDSGFTFGGEEIPDDDDDDVIEVPPEEVIEEENTVEAVAGPDLPPPTPPGGGGGGCVVLESYIPLVETASFNGKEVKQAYMLQPGNSISLNTADDELNTYIGTVVFNMVELQPCVRIETSQGISLKCSTTAPIFTKELEFVDAPDLLNKQILCKTVDGEFWDEVVSVESIDEQFVAVINAGDNAFWAGEQSDAYVLHHNIGSATDGIEFDKK